MKTNNSNSNSNNKNDGDKVPAAAAAATAEAEAVEASGATTRIITEREVHVKTLGRHARERLDEERSKRREIQRLADDDDAVVAAAAANAKGKRGRGTLVVDPLFNNKKKTKKKKCSTQRKRDFNEEEQHSEQQQEQARVDRWMPDVSHLMIERTTTTTTTSHTSSTSTVVQLHGLPVGTTAAPIRRFFSGLDPRRILLLLRSNEESSIISVPELDANYDKPPRKGGLRVERCRLRVLVVFESAPTALLAVQRSGEVMQVLPDNNQDENGACVAVTPVNKTTATYLVKHLAVDAVPGVPLEQTLQQIHAKLDPMVSTILWDAATHELHWNQYTSTTTTTTTNPSSVLQLRPKHWTRARNPRSNESQHELVLFQQWQDYRTALADQVDRLLLLLHNEGHPALLLTANDAINNSDNTHNNPCWTLTLRCVDVLRSEMARVDHAVTVAHRWKRLVATRGTLM